MKTRKEMKAAAKSSLKRHYFLFVIVCLIATFLAGSFTRVFDSAEEADLTQAKEIVTQDKSIKEAAESVADKKGGLWDVVVAAAEGDEQKAADISANLLKIQKDSSDKDSVLGRRNGVLAGVINNITSGQVVLKLVNAGTKLFKSPSIVIAILIVLAVLVFFSFWFYIKNLFEVIQCRFMMEGRIYEKVDYQRFMFLYKLKRWTRAAAVMLVKYIFLELWTLTLIGGIIKSYSYTMVPYIVAENPDIKPLEAITLSRKMMKGHKWELFVNDLSFLGWGLLNAVTAGILGVLFYTPYKRAFMVEYYNQLRQLAKDASIENADRLNDRYLYEKADNAVIREAYGDIVLLMEEPETDYQLKGIQGFFANVFGVVLSRNNEKEKAYEAGINRRAKIADYKSVVDEESYPVRLSPIPETVKKKEKSNNYMRHYSVSSIILMFFIFSLVGWIWEVSLHLFEDGVFVNRGVMHGPWLPIYGAGGVMIIVILNKFRPKPIVEFISSMVLCGIVEYTTAYTLEKLHDGMKWWDYSGYFLNLDGRICAEGLLVFGLGGVAMVYVFAPRMENSFRKVPEKVLAVICAVLLTVFVCDSIYSKKVPNTGKGISSAPTHAVSVLQLENHNSDIIKISE